MHACMHACRGHLDGVHWGALFFFLQEWPHAAFIASDEAFVTDGKAAIAITTPRLLKFFDAAKDAFGVSFVQADSDRAVTAEGWHTAIMVTTDFDHHVLPLAVCLATHEDANCFGALASTLCRAEDGRSLDLLQRDGSVAISNGFENAAIEVQTQTDCYMHVQNAWLAKLKNMVTKGEMQVAVRTALIPVVYDLHLCWSDIVFRRVYSAFEQHYSKDQGGSNFFKWWKENHGKDVFHVGASPPGLPCRLLLCVPCLLNLQSQTPLCAEFPITEHPVT